MQFGWNFSLTDFCPSDFDPFDKETNTLSTCFLISIQLPVFAFLAIFSAFYCGRYTNEILRDRRQQRSITSRIIVTFFLLFEPVLRILYMLRNQIQLYPALVLLNCFEIVGWTVHLGQLIALRKKGPLKHSGPLILIVLYSSITAIKIIWLEANLLTELWPWSVLTVLLLLLYGITFIFNGKSQQIYSQRATERTSLLRGYQRFESYLEDQILGPAQDGHNIISRMFFNWVYPLIKKGVANMLQKNDDLFDLPECLNIRLLGERLEHYLEINKSLFKSLHRSFGWEFYLIGIFRLISDLAGFAGPLLLGGLLATTENPDDTKIQQNSYYYAAGLLVSTLISALAGVHFNWRMSIVSMKMRTSLITAIYRKGLEAKELNDAKPEILNLMSTDTDRIVNSCISFHSLWSIPFQLFTTLYLLYTQVGSAFVSAVIFGVALIPINRSIAKKIGELSGSLMSAKDARVSVTSEALVGAKQIKLQALEDFWIEKIEKLRVTEVKYLGKRKYLDALCVYFWATTPVLMCLLTFGTQILGGGILTAATTYTAVSLLNMLIGPLNAFPWVLNGLTEAWVSLKRVQELIDLENINLSEFYSKEVRNERRRSSIPIVLSIENGAFEFDQKRDRDPENENLNQETISDFRLDNVNLEILKGELVCIEGPVGSGKTSLLNAILGNLKKIQGKVYIEDQNMGFGYVAQTSWLQRGTIRENILWGTIYDQQRYQAILKACALEEDLQILGGDHKAISDGGKTLSGGQRARLCLARAIYQNKDFYILDDFLSALDAHVAMHIIKHCIYGLLSKKTRIIVTEHKSLLDGANQIIHVDNGNVSFIDLMNDERSDLSDDIVWMSNRGSPRKDSTKENEDDRKSLDSCLQEEGRQFGKLSSNVLGFYFLKAMSAPLAFLVLLSVFLMQASRNITDAWLAHWVSENTVPKNNTPSNFSASSSGNMIIDVDQQIASPVMITAEDPSTFFLEVFAGLTITNSLITLVRSFLFAYAGIKAAKLIHNTLLNKVFFTKLTFFDVEPLGRILNRFSSDTYTCDDSLPFILNILLAQLFGLLGAVGIAVYAMPWLIILVIPMIPIYLNLQSKYRNASRDIKRLSSVALSPLYAQFTETLQGLTTIRAMRAITRFRQDFAVKLEESIRAQLTSAAAQQWLALRLQVLGAVIVGGAGFLTALTSAHIEKPGLVGLAISYALSISGLLSGVLNALAETEQELIAVERIADYINKLQPEPNADGNVEPPFAWPFQGVISFKNVSMSYRENLAHALNGLTFQTESYERVGIVGRTGAGKSSIIAALMRVAPLNAGEIIIDYQNIANLPLKILRSRVAIVPQEPFLFAGTVRENLDPYEVHLDSEIWNAITNCLASPLVQSLGGLHGKIENYGSNLSAGQKQLLCLTRALLKNSKIVLIDEGTANLDFESELAIQIVLRNAFKTSTVLIIAHRLNGLQNTDRIIVIENGSIVEQGKPKVLAEDHDTYLAKMLDEQKNKNFSNS